MNRQQLNLAGFTIRRAGRNIIFGYGTANGNRGDWMIAEFLPEGTLCRWGHIPRRDRRFRLTYDERVREINEPR